HKDERRLREAVRDAGGALEWRQEGGLRGWEQMEQRTAIHRMAMYADDDVAPEALLAERETHTLRKRPRFDVSRSSAGGENGNYNDDHDNDRSISPGDGDSAPAIAASSDGAAGAWFDEFCAQEGLGGVGWDSHASDADATLFDSRMMGCESDGEDYDVDLRRQDMDLLFGRNTHA
ncbi:hypothetical protein HDU82_008039, partial [Entophlyctis luteolus]